MGWLLAVSYTHLKPPAGYPFAMEGNLITMGESVRTARKSRKMSNFRGLEQILKKNQKK